MSAQQEPWLVAELRRMAKTQPERYSGVELALKSFAPGLYEELILAAYDAGDLNEVQAAEFLGIDPAALSLRMELFHHANLEREPHLVEVDEQGIARLAHTRVAVWEVVREHRRLGGMDALKMNYTGLTEGELRAALAYAERHTDLIEASITRYEELQGRKTAYQRGETGF
jgi:uncharacterized protein (DUF433 family)